MNKDKIINKVINQFQKLKGKASMYCFSTNIIPELIHNIIFKLSNKNSSILIVVDSYNTRKSVLNYIENNPIDNSNYAINCFSWEYIKQNYRYNYDLTIIIGVNNCFEVIDKLTKESKFTLAILTKNIMDNVFINKIRTILGDINIAGLESIEELEYIYSPVEEHRYGVELSDEDRKSYNKYTDYINTCISIFGDLSNIEKCKKGDDKLNISAAEFRNAIAKENGWNEQLDTTIPFMKQIDDVYNPNTLFERACNFYTIAKQRRDLVCDNEAKLEIIKQICIDNPDKKIIIISKRGEFAAKVTKYLNENSNVKCGDYHDCIEDTIALDDHGKPIIVKSGVNKGNPRVLGAQAQSTLNEKRFNDGIIKVLSIKSSSNTKLKTACDLAILTSSLCDNIIDVKKRFINTKFGDGFIRTYRIYCYGTIENEKLNKEKESNIVSIVDETEKNITIDENSGDIVL